jgi:broad specificity phosphatase PhoE
VRRKGTMYNIVEERNQQSRRGSIADNHNPFLKQLVQLDTPSSSQKTGTTVMNNLNTLLGEQQQQTSSLAMYSMASQIALMNHQKQPPQKSSNQNEEEEESPEQIAEEFKSKYRNLIAMLEDKYETMDPSLEGGLCFARSVNRSLLLCHNLAYTPIGRTLSRLLMDIRESDKRFFFAPLGETVAVSQGRFGVFDSPLTADGEKYSRRLADFLMKNYIKTDEELTENTTILTCSSSAGRRTVAPLVAKIKHESHKSRQVRYLHTLDDLNYGDCDGLTKSEIEQAFPRHASSLFVNGAYNFLQEEIRNKYKHHHHHHRDKNNNNKSQSQEREDSSGNCNNNEEAEEQQQASPIAHNNSGSLHPSSSLYQHLHHHQSPYKANWPRGESFEMMMQVRIEQHISELEAQTQRNIVIVCPVVVLQALLLYFDHSRYPVIRPEEAMTRVNVPTLGHVIMLEGGAASDKTTSEWERVY